MGPTPRIHPTGKAASNPPSFPCAHDHDYAEYHVRGHGHDVNGYGCDSLSHGDHDHGCGHGHGCDGVDDCVHDDGRDPCLLFSARASISLQQVLKDRLLDLCIRVG